GAEQLVQVSAGTTHTCGVSSSGSAYCWGFGQQGQLGQGLPNSSHLPVQVQLPEAVSLTSVSVGYNHTCGISSHGAAYCWGANTYGQLGNGSTTNSHVPELVSMPDELDVAV